MSRGGVCGRPDGHTGQHKSPEVERRHHAYRVAWLREKRHKNPSFNASENHRSTTYRRSVRIAERTEQLA